MDSVSIWVATLGQLHSREVAKQRVISKLSSGIDLQATANPPSGLLPSSTLPINLRNTRYAHSSTAGGSTFHLTRQRFRRRSFAARCSCIIAPRGHRKNSNVTIRAYAARGPFRVNYPFDKLHI